MIINLTKKEKKYLRRVIEIQLQLLMYSVPSNYWNHESKEETDEQILQTILKKL